MRTFTLFLWILLSVYLLLATGLLPIAFLIAVTVIVWKTVRFIRLGYKTTPLWFSGLITSLGMFVAGLISGNHEMNQWF